MPDNTGAPGSGWLVDAVLGSRGILAETRRQGRFVALVVGPAGRARAWSVIVGLPTGEKVFQASDLHNQQTAEALAMAQMAALARAESGGKMRRKDHA